MVAFLIDLKGRAKIVEKAHLLFREVEVTLAENYGVAMPAHWGIVAAAMLAGTAGSADHG